MVKFNSKQVILCFLMVFSVLLVGVSSVCAHDRGNITDLNNNDNVGQIPLTDDGNRVLEIQNANNLIVAGTFDDFQAEIDNATAGSVLNLTRDYNGAYGSRLQFSKDLTINGQGHTLDCLNTKCGAYSNNGSITLMNLIIVNGNNTEGGAIHIEGSAQYKIINCTFNNNWATDGGAIYNSVNKPLTIINSTFNNNWADKFGGAIHSVWDVYIENSTFESNTGVIFGGAIDCGNYELSNGVANINNSIFEKNRAGFGGAVYSDGVNINNSRFKKNNASNGGAIAAYRFTNLNNKIFNSEFLDNSAQRYGAISMGGDEFNIVNCIFINNVATSSHYGLGYGGGAIGTDKIKKVTIEGSQFSDNCAEKGGAIVMVGDELNIVNCKFINNLAKHSSISLLSSVGGGAIVAAVTEKVTIDGSQFYNNHADDRGGAIAAKKIIFKGENTFISNSAENYGGAIYTDTIEGNVDGITFTSNTAKNDGGAIYINCEYDGTFSHCVFDKNHANDRGGAIFINSHFSDITLTNNMFIENTATLGNSGFTFNIGGIAGDSFILGPNYYGETDNCRKGQFYFADINIIPNPMDLINPVHGHEKRVETWFKNPLDIYSDNAVVENGVTFEDVKTGIEQVLSLYSNPIAGCVPIVGGICSGIHAVLGIISWIKS